MLDGLLSASLFLVKRWVSSYHEEGQNQWIQVGALFVELDNHADSPRDRSWEKTSACLKSMRCSEQGVCVPRNMAPCQGVGGFPGQGHLHVGK